jgi:predicted RNase H-like HicB family nuclease
MLRIGIEQEDDGRWIGEVTALPGVLAYGNTGVEARSKAAALASVPRICNPVAGLANNS